MTACPDRELSVLAANGNYFAELAIARQPATLRRIFVHTTEGFVPSVKCVDIFGHTSEGHAVSERILPRRVSRF